MENKYPQWTRLIYIAAPYTPYPDDPEWATVEGNVEKYLKVVAQAMEDGYVVLSWIYNHLTTQMGLTKDKDAKFYLDQDKRLIDGCDEIWAAGPHNISSGMQEEIAHAQSKNIPVRYIYKEKHAFKPCPWCGSIPTLYWQPFGEHIRDVSNNTWKHEPRYIAKCSDPNCHASPVIKTTSLQETIRRWNIRNI